LKLRSDVKELVMQSVMHPRFFLMADEFGFDPTALTVYFLVYHHSRVLSLFSKSPGGLAAVVRRLALSFPGAAAWKLDSSRRLRGTNDLD
jgi:hypothetical protein